ncbi:MAG: type II toxin-antitoxin system HicA family toxin [Patescibacteria group bacterium]
MPQVKPLECIRALERLGFVVRHQSGSHVILRHQKTGKITSVPHHSGDLKRPLLMAIIKQSGFSQEEFLNVL